MAFKENVTKMATEFGNIVIERSPEILTGLGIAGMFTAIGFGIKATPEALKRIGKRKRELRVTELPKREVIKTVWKCYIPTAATAIISTGCIIGASSINYKRNMALAAAYTLSETAFKDYKTKVEETISKRDVERVNDAIAKDKIEKNPVDPMVVEATGHGGTLCCDITCDRYFRSDINFIKNAVNELNARLLDEQFISKNEFFAELGLKPTSDGYELGWDATDGLLRIEYSSQIASNGEPCLTINYPSSSLRRYRH